MCRRLLVLALVAMVSRAVLGAVVVDDHFDDGVIGTNTAGTGTGFNAGTWSTGTAITESGTTVTLENSEVAWARVAITSKDGVDIGDDIARFEFRGVSFSQSPNGWDWGGSTDRLALGVKDTNAATDYDAGLWPGFYVQFESDSLVTGVNSQFNGTSTLFYRSAGGVNTPLATWSFDTLNWDDWANFAATANFTPVLNLILDISPTGYTLTIEGDSITLLSGSLSGTFASAGITNELTTGYAFAYAQTENPSLFTAIDQIVVSSVWVPPTVTVYENDYEDPCQVDALSGWNWADALPAGAHQVAFADDGGNTVVQHTCTVDNSAGAAAINTRFGTKWGIPLSGNTSAEPNDYTIEFDVKSVSGNWDPIRLEFFVLTGGGNGVGRGSGISEYAQADGWVHVKANLGGLPVGWWAGQAWDMTAPDWQIELGGPGWPGDSVAAGTPAWDQVWVMDNLKITMIVPHPDTEGLVAYYALENDTNDSSGNGLNGVIQAVGGGAAPTFVDGPAGYGMAMDFLPTSTGTVGSVVNCGADPNFDLMDAITVGAWVNMRSIPDEWRAIVAKGDNAWRISNVGADPRFHFGFCGYASRPTTHGIDGNIRVGFGEWHYVCGTYDITDGAKLYVDGVLDVSVADTAGIAVNTNDVWIGGNNGDTGWKPYRLFDGMIDEVRIYNRALSADEIAYLAK